VSLPQDQHSPRSQFLDPYLSIKPQRPLARLADEIASNIEHQLGADFTRAPRRDATERRRQVVASIIANLVLLVLAPGYRNGDVLAISTAKTKPNRYDRSQVGRHLWGQQAGAMAEQGRLTRHPYVFKERVTTYEPTNGLREQLASIDLTLADIERREPGETIWLSARSATRGRYGEPAPKERIDYEDDADSLLFRRQMARINGFLNDAELSFDGHPQGPIALHRTFLLRRRADPVAFNLNGRLAGGWWLQLPARDRHRIRLNGEPLADLDFKGMFVQLAYRSLDWQLREDFDPYAIPGLEGHRDGAKLTMLSLLGRHKKMKALSSDLKGVLPEGWDARRLVAAASEVHGDISVLFGKDVAVQLMFQESQILVAGLLRLADDGVPALPMHDGVMVPQSKKSSALRAMHEVSGDWLGGAPLPVVEKPILGAL